MGDEDEIARRMRRVPPPSSGSFHAFCNTFSFQVLLGAQRVFGGMSPRELAAWRTWGRARGTSLVDAVKDPDDPTPYAVEVFKQVRSYARDPRLFWRIHRPRRTPAPADDAFASRARATKGAA